MRIFTAALATETNTFSPICVDRRAFEASLYAPPGQHPETPTLCTAPITVGRRVTREKGWELIEGTATWADPAGLVNRATYEELRDEILGQLRAAMPVDAVVMAEFCHQMGKFDAFGDRRDDRLFAEDLETGLKSEPDMVEMQVVGGADHQQIELFRGKELLRRTIGLAD